MQALTGIIAVVGCLLIFTQKPVRGLIVYCIGLFAYPQYVTLEVATIDFSISRILILALLAQALLRFQLYRPFRWNITDTVFLMIWACSTLALFANEDPHALLIRQGGAFFDSVFPYLAIRLIIRNRENLIQFLKGLTLIGVYLAILGLYQAITWHNPMGFLRNYAAWDYIVTGMNLESYLRHGLFRADVTFGQYIGFGMFFAATAPLVLALKRPESRWPVLAIFLCFGLLFMGMMSSMSSGPIFSIFVALNLIVFYTYRRFWKVALVGLVSLCLCVEFYSNRHFYDVLTRLAFNAETASYRIALYEEAFGGGMRDHWIFGWGLAGLYPRGPNDPFNWENRDMTSQYIDQLMRFGLMGLIPLLFMTFLYYKRLAQAFHLARTHADKWMVWCWSASMIGWSIGTLTVGFVGQMIQLSSLLIGVACNMPQIVWNPSPGPTARHRQSPQPAVFPQGARLTP